MGCLFTLHYLNGYGFLPDEKRLRQKSRQLLRLETFSLSWSRNDEQRIVWQNKQMMNERRHSRCSGLDNSLNISPSLASVHSVTHTHTHTCRLNNCSRERPTELRLLFLACLVPNRWLRHSFNWARKGTASVSEFRCFLTNNKILFTTSLSTETKS